jgi:hypothetical protein
MVVYTFDILGCEFKLPSNLQYSYSSHLVCKFILKEICVVLPLDF